MKRRRIGIVVIVLVAIAVFLVWRAYFQKKGEEGVLLLSGNLEVTEANVGFKISGRVTELAVDEGDHVQKGQVLARLDDAELASKVAEGRAALKESLSRLAELRSGSRPQEIEQAKANVRSQEAETIRLKKDYERAEWLYKNGAISTAQFDAAKSAFETRAAVEASSRETLSLVREGPRKEDIDAAEHRVEEARASLRTSEDKLEDAVIAAQTPGVILRKDVEVGEVVAAGTPVFTIGDLSSPWIKVYVPEPQMTLVKLGQKALVTTDTYEGATYRYRGKTYRGWVSYISNEAEFTPKNVQTQEERVKLVYGVKVRVEDPDQDLKPSMPADVRIQLKGLASPPPQAKPAEPPPQSSLRSGQLKGTPSISPDRLSRVPASTGLPPSSAESNAGGRPPPQAKP